MDPQETEDNQNQDLLSKELVLSSLVQEVTRVMHSAATLNQAMEPFLLGVTELTGVQNMALLGLKEGYNQLILTHGLGLPPEVMDGIKISPASGPVHACLISHRHLLVGKVAKDDPFHLTGAESYLVMPIITRIAEAAPGMPSCNLPLGALWLDTTPPGPELTGQTISHLSSLAQQAGLMMETWRAQRELAAANTELKQTNVKLNEAYAALSKAQKVIEKDLDRARAIQNNLLPTSFPDHLLRRISSKYIPAGMVGGDYYDCFELPSGNLGMVVADVSGHGIGAALVMSMFKVLLRTFSAQDPSPCSVLNKINATFMTQQLGAAQFVTAFYATFDKGTRKLTYCNAGHVAQVLRQNPGTEPARDCLVEMPSQGLVLGMFGDTFLSEATLDLAPEARIFLFTDGITEAHGVNGKMFGVEPLMKLAMGSEADHPAALIDSLMRTRSVFLGGSEQAAGDLADDATLVIVDV
ncbi:MAG: serine/threonine-protein phosphatase [Fibrobacterota bacterium]|nr:serine/threonine-protein phosphatase [Fibrobacterota bacterium]